MSNTTPETNMGLYVWDSPNDHFDYEQLAGNFSKIAKHDHTSSNGVKIPTGGIENLAITNAKIADATIDKSKFNSNTAAIVTPTYSGSLPSNPVDGQEIYYTADATNSVIWHLRYTTSGSPAKNRWEFIGGSSLFYFNSTTYDASTLAADTWTIPVGLSTVLSIPQNGKYEVSLSATLQAGGSTSNTAGERNVVYLGLARGSANPSSTSNPNNSDLVQMVLNSDPPDGTVPSIVRSDSNVKFKTDFVKDSGTFSYGDISVYIKSTQVSDQAFVKNISISLTPVYITA